MWLYFTYVAIFIIYYVAILRGYIYITWLYFTNVAIFTNFNTGTKIKNSYYYCNKIKYEECPGQVILSPNGTIVEQSHRSCKLPDTKYEKTRRKIRENNAKIDVYFYHFSHF